MNLSRRHLLATTGALVLGPSLVLGAQGEPRSPIRVHGVGVPGAATSRWGTRTTVVFRVSVRNDSSGAAPYLIRVELEGVPTSTATPISTLAAGAVVQVPVSVDVDLRGVAAGGDRLPFSVLLLDARRQQRNRFTGTLPVIPVAAAPIAMTPDLVRPGALRFSRDIAIERVGYAAAHGDVSAGVVVVARNRGRERWSYVASLGSQIALGTPETRLEWSDRLILGTAAVPPGLASGDSAAVVLRLQPVSVGTSLGSVRMAPSLPTELWLTVRVFLSTSYDVNPANDALYFVFRLNADHRVAESRILAAPPLTVKVNPQ